MKLLNLFNWVESLVSFFTLNVGGGGGGGGTDPYNAKPGYLNPGIGPGNGFFAGGGGQGGTAGLLGTSGSAGNPGSNATPSTQNCVPVVPGTPYPITVGSPGGQFIVSWNPQ